MDLFERCCIGVLLLLVAVAVLLLRLRGLRSSRRRRQYPPVVSTVFHVFLNLHRLHDFIADLARRHGTLRLLNPIADYVILVDAADVEHILRSNFANYPKGPYNHDRMSDLLGDGIFTVDGDKWRQQRKLASFEFTTSNLREYSIGVFRSKAAELALAISEAAACNRPVDIQELFMKSTLDSIFKVGFGVEMDALSGSNREGSKFCEAFDASSEITVRRYLDVLWRIKRFLNIGEEAKLKKHLKVIDDFVYKLIRRRTEQIQAQEGDVSLVRREDILSRFLVQNRNDQGADIDVKYLRDVMLNLLIAGRDTTAGTLSWFICMLCKHPEVQEMVAREVAMATEECHTESASEFSGLITEGVLAQMHYLHAVLSETLRLYPAVPADPKVCLSDDILPGGYDVKKGDIVLYVPYAMGRMKQLWGEDAEEFRPERWLDGEGAFRPESPFKFSVFQAGPRICLGKDFAYTQMKVFAAVLIHFFSFSLRDANQQVHYRSTLTLQIDGGLQVVIAPRKTPKSVCM